MNAQSTVAHLDRPADGVAAQATLAPAEVLAPARRDETDLARSQEYALLAALLLDAPDAATLARLARIEGDGSPLGRAHEALASAAAASSADAVRREFFELFIGVARGEVVPYASFYVTGFLNDRPLAKLRQTLAELGLERADGRREPEDHIGTLCEIMSGIAGGRFEVSPAEERRFFADHLAPWAERLFIDVRAAKAARFYKAVAEVGALFMMIEAEAFSLDEETERSGAPAAA